MSGAVGSSSGRCSRAPRRSAPAPEPQHPLVGGHPLVGDRDQPGLPAADQAAAGGVADPPERLGEPAAVLEATRRGGAAGTSPAASPAGRAGPGVAAFSGVSSTAIFWVRPGRAIRGSVRREQLQQVLAVAGLGQRLARARAARRR